MNPTPTGQEIGFVRKVDENFTTHEAADYVFQVADQHHYEDD